MCHRRWRMVGRIAYAPTTGYVRFFKILMQHPQPDTCDPSKYRCNPYTRVRARVQKMDLYTPPSVAYGGAYAIRPYGWVCAALRKTTPFSSPSGPLVGRMRYAPTIGYVRFFKIPMQFPNWIRAALQKTVLFSFLSGPSGGRIRYAPTTGYVRSFEIPMQSPDWVRVTLRNTDVIHRLGTCEGSKNESVYATDGGVW